MTKNKAVALAFCAVGLSAVAGLLIGCLWGSPEVLTGAMIGFLVGISVSVFGLRFRPGMWRIVTAGMGAALLAYAAAVILAYGILIASVLVLWGFIMGIFCLALLFVTLGEIKDYYA